MKELDVAIEAAKAAGKVLQQEYQKNLPGHLKADNTWMSDADLAAEKTITTIIKKNFPDHTIFSEEAGLTLAKPESLWIIDPLDGSTNFIRHLGNFCTAIAFIRDGSPVLAAVYLPLTDELFTAEVGKAAYLNGESIGVSKTNELKNSLVGLGRGQSNVDRHGHLYHAIATHARSTRVPGSAIINECHVACGRLDAYLYSDCKLYDAIAGAIITQSAGGTVTDFSGNLWQPNFSDPASVSDTLMSNPHIHADLVTAIKNL